MNGATLLTATTLFPSTEVRDTILKSGLESSVSQLYCKLAIVVASLS